MSLGKTNNKTVRKTIIENISKKELGHKFQLLKDKEAYIVAKIETKGARGLPRDTTNISDEIKQVIHDVGRRDANKTITPSSALRYAHRVIELVNKEEYNT